MPTFEIWAGQEIVHLRRFGAILDSARRLVGRDDHLANRLLEDALDELNGVLGDHATPVVGGSGLRAGLWARGSGTAEAGSGARPTAPRQSGLALGGQTIFAARAFVSSSSAR